MNVFETKQYDLFKVHPQQRELNEANVRKIVASMKEAGFLRVRPILVDEGMTIYDGAHRFEAAKRLKLPIWVMVSENLMSDHLVHLNEQKGWEMKDYLHYYEKGGHSEYIRLKAFLDKNTISLQLFMKMLKISTGRTGPMFRAGGFKCSQEAYDTLERAIGRLHEITSMMARWCSHKDRVKLTTTAFLVSLVHFAQDGRIDFAMFKNNFERKFSDIRRCANVGDFLKQWYEVYNYRLKNRVEME